MKKEEVIYRLENNSWKLWIELVLEVMKWDKALSSTSYLETIWDIAILRQHIISSKNAISHKENQVISFANIYITLVELKLLEENMEKPWICLIKRFVNHLILQKDLKLIAKKQLLWFNFCWDRSPTERSFLIASCSHMSILTINWFK
jgi:hypothetical protein